MRHLIGSVLALACCAAPVAADTVLLHDGTILQGQLKRHGPGGWVLFDPARKPAYFADADVQLIEVTARPAADPVAGVRRLDATRSAAAKVDDPAKAIVAYRQLLTTPLDGPTTAAARADLVVWQDRADRHLAKLGDKWVHPAARDQAVTDSLSAAGHARQLLKAGQFADAGPLVAAALAIDPQDASALYLQGLLRVQQTQLAAARRAFEAADRLVPNHAPTLNNLAVIAWQQRRYADALARYDQAMAAAPAAPFVLDNVAAALAATPAAVATDRVAGHFRDGAKLLADRMTAMGLHRFGTAWLTDAQLADVQQGQRQDRDQLDALTADFDHAQDAVRRTDLDIADVQQQMRRSAGSGDLGPSLTSYDVGRGGGLPVVYFELQNDAAQLQRRRAAQVARLDDVKQKAAAAQRRLSAATATPTEQHLIGPEGTPVRLPR